MTRRLVLVLALLTLAAPAAATAAATPAQLAIQAAKLSFSGKLGNQWDSLHPKYKTVVTRARFVACERKASAGLGKVKVLDVSAEGTQIIQAKVPLLGSVNVNDVTLAITYRRGAQASQIAEVESLWVAHRGHWVRIVTPTEYASYKAGKCP